MLKPTTRNVLMAVACVALAATLPPHAVALGASHFAASSKLASGNWVKVRTSQAGVYELTQEELSQMGFSDMTKVRIFGRAAQLMPESLEEVDFDDLVQIPAAILEGKLCFYSGSTFSREISTYDSMPYALFTTNCYSAYSYYFITDDSSYEELEVESGDAAAGTETADTISTSYATMHHEVDRRNIGQTGKAFFGEAFDTDNQLELSLSLPNYIDSTQIGLFTTVCALSTTKVTISSTLGGVSTEIATSTGTVSGTVSEHVYFNTGTARGSVNPGAGSDSLDYIISLSTTGELTLAYLDYVTMTYRQNNVLATDSAQLRLILPQAESKTVAVDGATASCHAWRVDSTGTPTELALTADSVGAYFASGACDDYTDFVVFNPTLTLLKISSYESVENQDLHAMEAPHMLIITQPGLKQYAQRVADLHAEQDGMDVAIVEQDAIFNEFSMGAPDAMAPRLFAKMLYCKDPDKFQYLLLFGGGTYDNRHLIGSRGDNLLITYQSDESNDETTSYTCDNFFGMLGDDAGSSVSKIPVTICVGRIPAKDDDDAQNAVSKLIAYVTEPDYGSWCNRMLISSDEGDSDIHIYQAEGVVKLIADSTLFSPVVAKAHVDTFEKEDDGYSIEGRRHFISELKRGVLLMDFVGHGQARYIAKTARIYTIEAARQETYEHLPFVIFASCDLVPFDTESRGMGEEMFFKADGGLIACIGSARTVYANKNDELNRAMVTYLFTLDDSGKVRTIGQAFAETFRSFGTSANVNKLNFQLIGDPAMRLHIPLKYAKITSIGGVDISADSVSASVYPMTEVTVVGTVCDAEGNLDTSFDGDVTVTLLDKLRNFTTITAYSPNIVVDHQRDELSVANGRVTEGKFEVTLLVPAECLANEEAGMLSVYAARDSGDYAVSGQTEQIIIKAYSAAEAISDTSAPQITQMYLNDETFSNGDFVDEDPWLHIEMTDDYGICSSTSAIAYGLKLTLDEGSTSYSDARNIVSLSESGRLATIDLQLTGLTYGQHTLTLLVCDYAGNCATRAIDFFVQAAVAQATLTADEDVARESATFSVSHDFSSRPTVTLFVLSETGETVWVDSFVGSSYEWDLKDLSGQRVEPGLYRYYGSLESGDQCGSGEMGQLVVLAADSVVNVEHKGSDAPASTATQGGGSVGGSSAVTVAEQAQEAAK